MYQIVNTDKSTFEVNSIWSFSLLPPIQVYATILRLKKIALVIAVLCSAAVSTKAFHLKIEIGDEKEFRLQSNTFLFGYYINQRALIDSSFSNNSVVFELSDKLPHGLYSVMIYTDMKDMEGKYQRAGFDVLITGEDLDFALEVTEEHTLGMVSALTGENLGYYKHFNKGITQSKRLLVVESALNEYPPGDEFYQQLILQAATIEREKEITSSVFDEEKQYPMANFYFTMQKKLQDQSIDGVNFANELLKQSQFIKLLVWAFLNSPIDEKLSRTSVIQLMYNRFSKLFPMLREDEAVYSAVLNEVLKYYEERGNNEAVVYLNEQFMLPSVCENQVRANQINDKNQALKKILIGETAPDIPFPIGSSVRSLHGLMGTKILLLFWETSCPHCQELTDELSAFYQKEATESFKIVAIAMDTSSVDYQAYVADKGFRWIDVTDFSGWNGKIAKSYNLLTTPRMYLLDERKNIVAKPISVSELKQALVSKN